MDISKLKFTIAAEYDCDEGEGCYHEVKDASYDEAFHMVDALDIYIKWYYHSMNIHFSIIDENGNPIKLPKSLEDDYGWILDPDGYYSWDKDEANSIPKDLVRFMKALKQDDAQNIKDKKKEIKSKIRKLEKEIKELKKELDSLS